MSKLKLKEDTINNTVNKEAEATKDDLERKLDNPIDADQGQIETALNEALASAKRQLDYDEHDREWPAILFIGEPGTGKTARYERLGEKTWRQFVYSSSFHHG